MRAELTFVPLAINDLAILHAWFQTSHVKKWYAKGIDFSKKDIEAKYKNRIEGKEAVPSFIAYIGQHPMAFIQYYSLSDFLPEGITNYNHELFNQFPPSDIAGIDLFIGDENYLGKGYGAKILNSFLNKIIFPKFKIAVIDPDIENERAIKVYKSVGFTSFSIEKSEQYNDTIQLMILKKDSI
ncbi:MAG: GNAT family N-acetyltransferase [Proteobacteria bacterium]|nr:GNAT family N-acetyltransferase [Pseudomonadota bacterium]